MSRSRTEFFEFAEDDQLFTMGVFHITRGNMKKALTYFDDRTKDNPPVFDKATGETLYMMYEYAEADIPSDVHTLAGSRPPPVPRRLCYSNTPICKERGECNSFAYFRDEQTGLRGQRGGLSHKEAKDSDRVLVRNLKGTNKKRRSATNDEGLVDNDNLLTNATAIAKIEELKRKLEEAKEALRSETDKLRTTEIKWQSEMAQRKALETTVETLQDFKEVSKKEISALYSDLKKERNKNATLKKQAGGQKERATTIQGNSRAETAAT